MDSCKVLLLDEPTAALDPRSADVVMRTADKLISDFKLTAILITHNLKDAYNYGTRIIQMGEGLVINDLNQKEKAELKQNDLFDWFA
jgi:putative ABC transport system ATP-binding protein